MVVIKDGSGPSDCLLIDQTLVNVLNPERNELSGYLIQHIPTPGFEFDLSQSKCGTENRFELRSWKSTRESPNLPNLCLNTQKNIPDDNIDNQDLMEFEDDTDNYNNCGPVEMDEESLQKDIEHDFSDSDDTCSSEDFLSQRGGELDFEFGWGLDQKKKLLENPHFDDSY